MKKIILFFCICIVIFSCKKKESPTLDDFTYNFTEPFILNTDTLNCPPNNTVSITEAIHIYERPIFNPLNPNEIAFLHRPWDQASFELFTFNFKTGKKFKVTSRRVICMDWSIDNWIVFVSENSSLWKIKSNGTELTEIEFDSFIPQFIKFSPDAKKIIFDRPASFSFGRDKITLNLTTEDIEILSPLEFKYFRELDWKNDQLIYPILLGIEMYDLQSNLISKVDSFLVSDEIGTILSTKFTIDDDIFWLTKKSIYKTNIISGDRTIIKNFGPNEDPVFMDVSIDKKTILVHKKDQIVMNPCTLRERNYLVLIDIDGANERKIFIPN